MMKQDPASSRGIKARLLSGRSALCCLANMGSPVAAEILGHAGYDAVMIDMEHGPGDVLNTVAQLQALGGTPAAALVRVPENAPVYEQLLRTEILPGIAAKNRPVRPGTKINGQNATIFVNTAKMTGMAISFAP